MSTIHLTKRVIDQAVYQGLNGGFFALWDDALPGFGVRVFPTGLKSFIVKYRVSNRQRIISLGRFGVLTLDQARNMAREHLVNVSHGDDPLATRQGQNTAPTIKQFAERYLNEHALVHKRSARNDKSHVERYIIPAWGSRKLASITTDDVHRLHNKLGRENGHYQANRVIATISKMYALAESWRAVERGFQNPARGVQKFKEERRHHAIEETALPALAAAIDAETSPFIRAAIWLLLYTGCRKSEILTARWEQIDFERRTLTVLRTKAGRPYVVPLSHPALTLLKELPQEKDNPYIIPGRPVTKRLKDGKNVKEVRPLNELLKPWRRILKQAGLPANIRLHDLRHTFGTSLSNAGVSLTIVGAALNHSQPSVTARYAIPAADPVRQAFEDHGARMVAAVRGEKPAEVVEIHSTRKGRQ